ncbi:MAG TPA: hypothetical protein VGI73_14730 [Solirubrobacterales bacterium]|jgi:hypothetical protein
MSPRFRPFRGAGRNADLGLLHETFFIAAVTTILCIRTQLWLTNYPQLGGHGLHIAHLLWGGLLMVIALAILLSLLGRRARWPAAVIGGVGFGFFIDELGKFITADNNYFFKPAAGLIYLTFVTLFLVSRAYQRHRGLNDSERVRNAIELIGEATIGPLREGSRRRAQALLAGVPASNQLRAPLLGLLEGLDATPDPDPPWFARAGAAVARRYESWARQDWFHGVITAVFVFWAGTEILTIVGLVLGSGGDSLGRLSFVNVASLASTAVSTVLVVVGLARLARGRRLVAYAWLARALLVSIFVTRVFSFVESQFGAVIGLAFDLLLLISVQLMAAQERRRQQAASIASPP